jgi:hypothetical protein
MASREIALLSRAQHALAEARTVDEFRDVRDMAEAAKGYARRKKVAREVLLEVACLAIQAEHGLGTALSQMDLAKGKSSQFRAGPNPKFLTELGLTKQESHRAQLLAVVPKEKLEHWLADYCALGKELTLTAAREYAQEFAGRKLRVDRRRPMPRTPIDALTELLEHQKMLVQLVRPLRDGGTIELKAVEGRLICRLTDDIGELTRQLARHIQQCSSLLT